MGLRSASSKDGSTFGRFSSQISWVLLVVQLTFPRIIHAGPGGHFVSLDDDALVDAREHPAFDSQRYFGCDETNINGMPRQVLDYGGQHPLERNMPKEDENEDSSRFLQTNFVNSSFQPMRIEADTSSLSRWEGDEVYAPIAQLIHDTTDSVTKYLSETLSVVRQQREIDVAAPRCGLTNATEEVRSFGSDYVLIVRAETNFTDPICAANTTGAQAPLAFAGPCILDQFFKPIAGVIFFCMNILQLNQDRSVIGFDREVYDIYMHESLHAFGFVDFLFPVWTNRTTGNFRAPVQNWIRGPEPLLCIGDRVLNFTDPGDGILRPGRTKQGVLYFDIVTPTVANTVRNHFNCQSLPGARLQTDDLRNSSCFGSHWNNRVFHSELMTPFAKWTGTALSPVTLAFLEDTGFYVADFSKAEVTPFGRGRGCAFVEDDCITEGAVPNYGVGSFCAAADEMGCGPFHEVIAACNVTKYREEINPSFYQWFDDAAIGGRERMDYCPVYEIVDLKNETTNRTTSRSCLESLEEGASKESIEVYGSTTSRCFERANPSRFVRDSKEDRMRPLCLESRCNERKHMVEVVLGDDVLSCRSDGDRLPIPVEGYEGQSILCPRLADICPHLICPGDCAGRGICDYDRNRPKCVCFDPNDPSPLCASSPVVAAATIDEECLDEANFVAPGFDSSSRRRGRCSWIGNSPRRTREFCASTSRRVRSDVLQACPKACTDCGRCGDDFGSNFTLVIPSRIDANCAWIKETAGRIRKYCKFVNVARESCPQTCGVCSTEESGGSDECTDDDDAEFPRQRIKQRVNCSFLANLGPRSRSLLCEDDGISQICPRTCEKC